MLVETFEADTTDTLTLEERTECEQILDSLSLLKQKAFVGESAVNPFRVMSKEEQRVYSGLLSSRDSVEDFDASAIPLRVLKTIQLCVQNLWFE